MRRCLGVCVAGNCFALQLIVVCLLFLTRVRGCWLKLGTCFFLPFCLWSFYIFPIYIFPFLHASTCMWKAFKYEKCLFRPDVCLSGCVGVPVSSWEKLLSDAENAVNVKRNSNNTQCRTQMRNFQLPSGDFSPDFLGDCFKLLYRLFCRFSLDRFHPLHTGGKYNVKDNGGWCSRW